MAGFGQRRMRGCITHSPDYFILFVLLEGARHGYGMAKAIEELTAGQITLEVGNLYHRTASG